MKTNDNQGTTITGVKAGSCLYLHSGHLLRKFANFDFRGYFMPYFGHFCGNFDIHFKLLL